MGWVGQEDSLVHESSRCASIHLSLAHICNPGTAFVRWWVETKLPGSFQVGSQELAAGQKQEDPFLNKAEDKTNSSDSTLDMIHSTATTPTGGSPCKVHLEHAGGS